MWANGELGQFIWIAVVAIAIAVPMILRKVRLPRRLQFETLSDENLTKKQRDFLAAYDCRLKELGFAPFATYRVTNIPGGKNLLRSYISSTDPTRCTVQVSAVANGPVQFDHVEFITDYADRSQAVTTNRAVSPALDRDPDRFVQECRGMRDLAQLKQRHERFSDQFQARGPVFTDTQDFFAEQQRQYEKQLAYQVNRNLLRPDAAGEQYRVTLKWALRMQRNMFNPFADNFTLAKLGAALGVGSLPVIVGLHHTYIVHWLGISAGVPPELARMFLLTSTYGVAGIGAGLFFGHKSFVWCFLLAYIPTLVFPAATIHTLQASFLMALVADLTFRVRGRRKRLV